jgi:hypothetical protein
MEEIEANKSWFMMMNAGTIDVLIRLRPITKSHYPDFVRTEVEPHKKDYPLPEKENDIFLNKLTS